MADQVLSGPAFSKPFKVLAWALCLGLIVWTFLLPIDLLSHSGWWVASALALIVYTVWHIQSSVTTLDAHHIHQTWVWDKSMQLSDMAYIKVIHVPSLSWLIAPRVYARTMMGKFAVFYTASPDMLKAFEALAEKLKNQRINF